MKCAVVLGAVLLTGAVGVASAAEPGEATGEDGTAAQSGAESQGERQARSRARRAKTCGEKPCPVTVSPPSIPYYAIPEHRLAVVDAEQVEAEPEAHVSEQLEPLPEWDWPRQHLAARRRFIDSYLGPKLYPEISVGTQLAAANVVKGERVEFASEVDLSLYFLEIQVPVISRVDGAQPTQRVGLNLKIPFAWPGAEAHRFQVVYGASVNSDGPALSNSSRFHLMYGYGGPIAVQLRVGYGFQQLTLEQPLRIGLLYGGQVGFTVGKLQPSVEVDGIRTTETKSDRISIIPGFRVFPTGEQTVQLGLGALIVVGDGQDLRNNRVGAIFQLSYNFL